MDGVLNLNKPAGPTSHDIVDGVRRILGERRVGHVGTLDPAASGVLLVCTGKATRIGEYLVAQEKEYLAEMVLGRTTTTQDGTGEVTSTADASHITREMVEDVLPLFTGRIMQIPPMFSALKHQGRRLYELARKDIEVERKPREVTVYELEITGFSDAGPGRPRPVVGLRIVCSSGTYIRTLCADIGEVLGVGGYMQNLVRARIGRFALVEAVDLDTLERAVAESQVKELVIPMDEAIAHLPEMIVDADQVRLVANGNPVPARMIAPEGTIVRLKAGSGQLLAVGRLRTGEHGEDVVLPDKVFVEAGS